MWWRYPWASRRAAGAGGSAARGTSRGSRCARRASGPVSRASGLVSQASRPVSRASGQMSRASGRVRGVRARSSRCGPAVRSGEFVLVGSGGFVVVVVVARFVLVGIVQIVVSTRSDAQFVALQNVSLDQSVDFVVASFVLVVGFVQKFHFVVNYVAHVVVVLIQSVTTVLENVGFVGDIHFVADIHFVVS